MATITAHALLLLSVSSLVLLLSRAWRRWPFVLPWLALTAFIGWRGDLADFSYTPALLQRLLLPTVLLTVVVALRGRFSLTLRALVLFQTFRIAVEVMLWLYYRDGVIPEQMTFEGRNWDILTGLLALPVALRPSRPLLWAWNILGLGLLLNVVIVANLSFPTPYRRFPELTAVVHFPLIWLPLFLVPMALFGHLLLFRFLFAKRRLDDPTPFV